MILMLIPAAATLDELLKVAAFVQKYLTLHIRIHFKGAISDENFQLLKEMSAANILFVPM